MKQRIVTSKEETTKVKSQAQKAHLAGAYPWFLYHKATESITCYYILPPGLGC